MFLALWRLCRDFLSVFIGFSTAVAVFFVFFLLFVVGFPCFFFSGVCVWVCLSVYGFLHGFPWFSGICVAIFSAFS